MPGKKEQIALQKEVASQEQWEELLSSEGVVVIDVYQRWCGPCNAVVSLFRRMRNETGDDLLKLAVAEADSIDALEKYRGQCQPCFLFFAGGQLVHVIRGVQGPALVKAILEQLEAEHKVLDNGAERKVVVDPLLAQEAAKERARSAADEEAKKKASAEAMSQELEGLGLSVRPVSQGTMDTLTSNVPAAEPIRKEVTVVVIKPDAVQAGKTEEIIQRLASLELEILAQEERTLTEDEAREFYKAQEGEDHFESLVQFMSSGPCHILVVTKGDTGQGVVSEVRSILGPKDINIAKEESPESLRALYGTDTTMNALHGADSAEMAARELTFFFPDFRVPTVPGTGPPRVEKTLALIRPEALKEHRDEILEKVQEAGFEVCLQKEVQLTDQQARDFYREHEGQPFYDELIAEMTKGPILALGLAKESAIQGWRNMLGPKEVEKAKEGAPDSLRARFSSTSINALHGSDSNKSAQKELEFFFPKEHTMAVIKPDAADEHKDAIIERLQEAGFQIASEKHMPLTREMAAQLYHEHEGKEFYESLLDHMTSGPSTMLLLNREDAIHGLRTLMGPADPDVAREQAPESFRALLGKDVLHNAIHGSSSLEQVNRKIEHFFPEVELTEDGQIVVPEVNQGEEAGVMEGEDSGADDASTEEQRNQSAEVIHGDVTDGPVNVHEEEGGPDGDLADLAEPSSMREKAMDEEGERMVAAEEMSEEHEDRGGEEPVAEETVALIRDDAKSEEGGLFENMAGDEQHEGGGGIVRDDDTMSLGADGGHQDHNDVAGTGNEEAEVEADGGDGATEEEQPGEEGTEGAEESIEPAAEEGEPTESSDIPADDASVPNDDAPVPTDDTPAPTDEDGSTPEEKGPSDDSTGSKTEVLDGEVMPSEDSPPSENAPTNEGAPPTEEAPPTEDATADEDTPPSEEAPPTDGAPPSEDAPKTDDPGAVPDATETDAPEPGADAPSDGEVKEETPQEEKPAEGTGDQ